MPVFPKPSFPFTYALNQEIQNLRTHKQARLIPQKTSNRAPRRYLESCQLRCAEKADSDLSLLAEITIWFDVVALQECRENYGASVSTSIRNCQARTWVLMSDVAGNNERMASSMTLPSSNLLEGNRGNCLSHLPQYKNIKLPG